MSNRETVIRVRQLPNGQLEYEDWRGNVQTCAPAELGARTQAILQDPDLPPVEVVNPGATRVAEFYARALLPPELRHLAQPGVNALQDLLRAVQQRRRAAPAAPSSQQSNPGTPPDPPRHPPRSAHRRGQRVA
jgi:hypothetical protein